MTTQKGFITLLKLEYHLIQKIKTLLPERIKKCSICSSIIGETMLTALFGGNAAGT